MTSLDSIISVSISRETSAPTRVGFGTGAFLSDDAIITDRVKKYSSLQEITDDAANAGADSVAFATAYFGQNLKPTALYIIKLGADTITDALDDAESFLNDWYSLHIYSRVAADITEASTWVNARIKIFGAVTADAAVIDPVSTTDIAYTQQAASAERTFIMYDENAATQWIEGAWFGLQLPKDPGSTNWAYKTLNNITPSDLNDTESNAVLDKDANVYVSIAGVNVTQLGRGSGSEYVDIIRGSDWIVSHIKEDVFTVLINSEKVPFTNQGIDSIVSAVRGVLIQAQNQGILSVEEDFVVTAPKASEVSLNDKTNRLLPNVTFEATLAGAINKTTIFGTLVL